MQPHVFIVTPTSRQLVYSLYTACLVRLSVQLALSGIKVSYAYTEGYDLAQQRDFLAHRFLRSEATHMLMVDDDMGYDADLGEKLLTLNKPLVAVACPLRIVDPADVERLIKQGLSGAEAMKAALKYTMRGAMRNDGSVISASEIGAGIMMISRGCFKDIEKKTKVAEYTIHAANVTNMRVKSFFHREVDEKGELWPEDYSFCLRWRKLGGEVFVYPHANVQHIGPQVFGGGSYTEHQALIEKAKANSS